MRKSLDGEAIDGRSHSLDKDQLDFALNFDELDLVFAFASPQIFQNTKVLNDSEEPDYQKIELLNHREEFKIINNTLIVSQLSSRCDSPSLGII
ncbi:unnamed protein product [Moneuplotes crassus]|uniref:Uncharacterized protein n=1 Tax=Euplotes crassus TaxID=5936 RepID=A0AAD1UJZ6_EUPCR|nr:unnamed protein product [Moneuplotes crassus]